MKPISNSGLTQPAKDLVTPKTHKGFVTYALWVSLLIGAFLALSGFWIAKALADVDGEKFNEDVLYCQEFSKWGFTIQGFTNLGADFDVFASGMYGQLSHEVRVGITTANDSILVVLEAKRIFESAKGYGQEQRKLDFYTECMQHRGHQDAAPPAKGKPSKRKDEVWASLRLAS
jgi:hypothetical protein